MTYSIVARDPETGELGVAVQTRSFAVGAAVPWAKAGVGAVATQSFTERSYGPLGLELLRAGRAPEDALAGLVTADPQENVRQVGIVDATGRGAAHTGELCIKEAGHLVHENFTVQANMMSSAEVWPAMASAYGAASGSLPQRLLGALDAGEAAGGDFRGRQTAAMLVVEGKPSGRPWADRVIDVRVDDHADPLTELRRLVTLAESYRRLNRLSGQVSTEELSFARAAGVAEDHLAWSVVTAAWRAGDLDLARRRLDAMVSREPRWEHAWDVLRSVPPPVSDD
ncbi:MAG: DUF1028 domain-containing protein [Gaiellaceae bacterium]